MTGFSMTDSTLFAAHAYLPEGWRRNVLTS